MTISSDSDLQSKRAEILILEESEINKLVFRLKILKEKRKFTYKDLATVTSISEVTLYRQLTNPSTLRISTLLRLCQALEISLSDLLADDFNKKFNI